MAQTPFGYEASRVTRLRDGKVYATNCLMWYGMPVSVEAAVELVNAKKVAFVEREDAKIVLAVVSS